MRARFTRTLVGQGGALRLGRLGAVAVFLSTAAVCTIVPGPAVTQSFSFSAVQVQGNERIEQATVLARHGPTALNLVERRGGVKAGELMGQWAKGNMGDAAA